MKEYIAEYIVPVEKKGNDYMFDFMNAKPMIRCKNCRFRDDFGLCRIWRSERSEVNMDDDEFCSDAEPKENGQIRCKDCIHNVANRETDTLDTADYSGVDIVCDYFMTDGQEPDDYCSHAERKKE